MLFVTSTKTNDIKHRTSPPEVFLWKGVLQLSTKFTLQHPCRKATQLFLKWHFRMGLLLQICCIFAGHTFEEKQWGTASKRCSFVQVNCKYYLHKLKWTNLILQKFRYLFVGLQFTKVWSVNYNSWSTKFAA